MIDQIQPAFPDRLHIVTYDVRGYYPDSGEEKSYRQTGLVTQTHQLIGGLVEIQPDLRLAVTQTGVKDPVSRPLIVPEGPEVHLQGIQSGFSDLLNDPVTGGKDKKLLRKYYEDEINHLTNPLYYSLARQYANVVRNANSPNLLLQNSNPVTSMLKAEELGFLDDLTLGQLNVVGVIHDIETYEGRLGYIIARLETTKMNLKLVAVSEFVYRQLLDMGAPAASTFKAPNGLDINAFQASLERTKEQNTFETVAQRNMLPEDGKMVLVPGRRAEHKGHLDVIQAVSMLQSQGKLGDMFVAFTGCNMLTTQALNFESVLRGTVARLGLEDKIFFLDQLTDDEIASCYGSAYASVLASTEPEGFAYANVQAMLAHTPVITTRMGGPLDYIQDRKTGMFVEPHDPEGIAQALSSLTSDTELYNTLLVEGRNKASEYTIDNMVQGYVRALVAGQRRLPLRIHPRSKFEKVGEGMHTEVYRHEPSNGFVVQVVKPEHELSQATFAREYDYLCEAYAEMPGLIPSQRIVAPSKDAPLEQTLIVKREVVSDPSANTLRKVSPENLNEQTLQQLVKFVSITKSLFTYVSDNPELRELGSRVPDLIDPAFENLLIDTRGNLRLVDTNKTISTKHLKKLAEAGDKLDIENKKIHSLLLRRLMYIEAKFFGRTRESLKTDPFYAQFLAEESFDKLFEQSEAAGENI